MEKIINSTCKIYIDEGYRNFQKSLCEACEVESVEELNKIYDAYNDEEVEFTLNNGILTLNMKSSSYRLLIVR